MSTDKALSWVYSEEYAAETEAKADARATAKELGAAPVSTGTGAALRAAAAMLGARAIIEVGTGAGVSGQWLLEGMQPDGVLTTVDVEPEFQRAAKQAFAAAGNPSRRARLIAGRALDVLPRLAKGSYDMVVIDADVPSVPEYVEHALRLLRPGGVVALTHALWHDHVADPARRDDDTVTMRETLRAMAEHPDLLPCLLPTGDGLALAVRA